MEKLTNYFFLQLNLLQSQFIRQNHYSKLHFTGYLLAFLFALISPAHASYVPFNSNVPFNVGIGTSTPQGALVVTSGNVGIGTWTAAGGNLIIRGGGNVGIGSAWPGQALDVNGTVRAAYFVGNGSLLSNLPASGGWTLGASNVGISTTNNVGIGTFSTKNSLNILGNIGIGTVKGDAYLTSAAPNGGAIIYGNVGIGSFIPQGTLDVEGGTSAINTNGSNINIIAQNAGGSGSNSGGYIYLTAGQANSSASNSPDGHIVIGQPQSGAAVHIYGVNAINADFGAIQALDTVAPGVTHRSLSLQPNGDPLGIGMGVNTPAASLDVEGVSGVILNAGNVGIGSTNPSQELDVNGTVRASYFIGDGSLLSNLPSSGGGWTLGGGNVGISTTNNVGIGTNLTTTAGLTVMNGNVGIGTWVPGAQLQIGTGGGTVSINSGSITVGSTVIASQYRGGGGAASGITLNSTTYGAATTDAIRFQLNNGSNVLNLQDYSGTYGIGIGTLSPTGVEIEGFNVGIGTAFTGGAGEAALTVMNGNVGIGTWVPGSLLAVGAGNFLVDSAGHVTASSTITAPSFIVDNNSGGVASGSSATPLGFGINFNYNDLVISTSNNVGIGSTNPGQELDVNGTVRASYFIGDGSLLSNLPASGGWTLGASNVGISTTNNVGIGTNLTTTAGLTVMNGNVGIGTWKPASDLTIHNASSDTYLRIDKGGAAIDSQEGGIVYSYNDTPQFYMFSDNADDGALKIESAQAGVGESDSYPRIMIPRASTDLYLGLSGGNVGIGTAQPQALLHVFKAAAMQVRFESQTSWAEFGFKSDIAGTPYWAFGTGWPGAGSTRNFYLQDATASGSPVRLIVDSNGNVGIGTFDQPQGALTVKTGNVGIDSLVPGQTLDVVGTVRATAFVGDGSGLSNLPASSGGGWTLGASNVGISTTNNVGIGTNLTDNAGLSVMNGNVGIGTWVPSAALEVYAPSGNVVAQIRSGGGGNGILRLSQDNSSDWNLINNNGDDSFDIDQGATEEMVITSSGNAWFANNVGIGTAMPSASVELIGNGAGRALLGTNGCGNNYSGITLNGVADTSCATYNILSSPTDQNLFINRPTGSDILFRENNVNQMIIKTGGNVGIGTTLASPIQQFEVVSPGAGGKTDAQFGDTWPIYAVSNDPNIGFNLYWNGSNWAYGAGSSSNYGGTIQLEPTTGQFQFISSSIVGNANAIAGSTTTNFVVNANGNVGIGTIDPGTALEVNSSNGEAVLIRNTSASGYSQIQYVGTGRTYQTGVGNASETTYGVANKYYLFDSNANAMRMVVDSAGNVGIGTWVPSASLQVQGQMFTPRYPLTDGATIAVDWNNGNVQSVTLGGSRTFTFANGQDGGKYILIIKQDGSGNHTVMWPGSVRWSGGTAPTLTTTLGKTDYFAFIYNGVDSTYDGVAEVYNF